MTYTATTRNRYRLAVWTTTATVAAGAIAATGWVAGTAAHEQAQEDALRQAEQDNQARAEYAAWLARYGEKPQTQKPRVVMRQHPARTRITTRYVVAASPTAPVGPGGSVTTSSPQPQQASSSGNGSGQQTQATQTPPPPPPPPTPTSGS